MKIESKGTPWFAHPKAEDQTGDDRNNPGQRTQHARRREINRLLINKNGAALEWKRREGAPNQPECDAQDHGREDQEDKKYLELGPEDEPKNGWISKRTEPRRW